MTTRRLFAGFRGRLVLATTLLTLVTLGGAFVAVYEAVNLSHQRRLDRVLLAEARREASQIALQAPDFVISELPGPAVNDVGPLPKHGALVEGLDVKVATPNFASTALDVMRSQPRPGSGFDFWHDGVHLRGVMVEVPGLSDTRLILAISRTDLDGDATFLVHAMRLVFLVALAWTTLVAWAIVRRLTRVHQRIAQVVHRVAAGNLSTRVAPGGAPDELAEMGRDIDELIDRLSALVRSQQQFIAHAAHELRSPLTTLYGELSLALRRDRTKEEYQRAVEDALESARRLKLLAEDLLALARIGTTPVRATDRVMVEEVLNEARTGVRAELEGRGVTVRITETKATVPGRKSDLVRLFRNLFENAARHSPPGGVIEVTSVDSDGAVKITVSDQGPGVAAQDRELIFEPFYRAAEARAGEHQGAGLGLPIARHLASMSGGSLELAPAESGNTRLSGAHFLVTLPNSDSRK
jgi:two-component system OmpR family sensor kinase